MNSSTGLDPRRKALFDLRKRLRKRLQQIGEKRPAAQAEKKSGPAALAPETEETK